MAAIPTRGIKIYITRVASGDTNVEAAFTAMSNATPSVVTMEATELAKVKAGDTVRVSGANVPDSVAAGAYIAGSITATGFTLLGSRLADNTTTIGAGSVEVIPMTNVSGDDEALQEFCLASLDYATEAAPVVDVSTTCGKAQVTGEPGNGTLTWTGYMEDDSIGFDEFVKANGDGYPRMLEIVFPNYPDGSPRGAVIFPEIIINNFTWAFSVEGGAVTMGGGAIVNEPPVYARPPAQPGALRTRSGLPRRRPPLPTAPGVPLTPVNPAPPAPATEGESSSNGAAPVTT